MKTVILKKQYPLFPYYPPETELSFMDDAQADDLIDKGIAKSLEMATKDKMVRRGDTRRKSKVK